MEKRIIKIVVIGLVAAFLLSMKPVQALTPPLRITIDGIEGVKLLVKMTGADDKTFKQYYDKMGGPTYIESQQSASSLLALLDKLYFPVPKNGTLPKFIYQPYGEYAFCSYDLNGNYYLFDFWGKENYASEVINKTLKQENLNLVYKNQENTIKIYQITEVTEDWTTRYAIDVHGFYMLAHFRQNSDVPTNGGYELFEFKKLNEMIDYKEILKPPAPKNVKISRVKAKNIVKRDRLKISWRKVSGQYYTVEMSKKETKGFKTIKGYKKNLSGFTKKKLKKGSKYYFRVRTYKVVDGKKYYSNYSEVKSKTV